MIDKLRTLAKEWDTGLVSWHPLTSHADIREFHRCAGQVEDLCTEAADRIEALEAEHKGCDYALRQSEQIRKDVEADLKIAEAERWKCSLNWHNVSAALSETIKKNEVLEARLAAAEARLKAAEAVCFYVERSYRMCEEEGDIMGGGNAYQDALTALAAWRLAKGGDE